LKNGKALAAGKKTEALTAKNLSHAFGAKIKLRSEAGRFAMNVLPKKGAVV